jgi:hypothetical protein
VRKSLMVMALAATSSAPAIADQTEARIVGDVAVQPMAQEPATIDVVLSVGSERVWNGSLRLGAPYGNASYSQSKSEYADPCPGEPSAGSPASNQNLRLYINRTYAQQMPEQFNVNVNWVRPVPECQGGGTNTVGIQRQINLLPGQTVTVTGEAGLVVKLTRRP